MLTPSERADTTDPAARQVADLRRREDLLGRLAVACVSAGFVIVFASIACSYWIEKIFAGRQMLQVMLMLLPAVLFLLLLFAANALLIRHHTTQALRVRVEAKTSPRRPVLICRSFDPVGLAFHPAVWVKNARYGRHRRDSGSYVNDLADGWAEGYLVAIGAPTKPEDLRGDVHGLYFQTPEQDWEAAFLLAARSARFIWVIPEVSSGVVEEMRVLRESGMTTKTIVFMPPQPVKRGLELLAQPYCDPGHFRKHWEETANRWRLTGCALPGYDRDGAIFTCNQDFSVRSYVGLNGSTARLRELLPALVETIADESGVPIAKLVKQLELIECDAPKARRIDNFYIP